MLGWKLLRVQGRMSLKLGGISTFLLEQFYILKIT
jgi:hypothetical protein